MKHGALSSASAGVWLLSGVVDVDTVPGLLVQSKRLFQIDAAMAIDCSGVEKIDSAGLALLVEWRRRGRSRGMPITLRNIPAAIRPVAETCGLMPVLSADAF